MHYYLVSSKLVLDKTILEIPTYEAKKKTDKCSSTSQ